MGDVARALSEPYRIAVVMTFRGPPDDTIKILSLLSNVMDSVGRDVKYVSRGSEILMDRGHGAVATSYS